MIQVLVLAVDEKYVSKTFQRQIADANNELNLDDAVRITGCWNGLAKRFAKSEVAGGILPAVEPGFQPGGKDDGTTRDDEIPHGSYPAGAVPGGKMPPSTAGRMPAAPMRRAVAFSRSIKDSKVFVEKFGQIVAAYRETHPDAENLLRCELDHVDGTYDALKRNARLDWLKAASSENTCRILSNARCLSEGVDVPALDAEEALKDNEEYKVVWQVLQALRAHDDRFNATVNQIELNKQRPDVIQVIGIGEPAPDQTHDGYSMVNSLDNVAGILA